MHAQFKYSNKELISMFLSFFFLFKFDIIGVYLKAEWQGLILIGLCNNIRNRSGVMEPKIACLMYNADIHIF